MEAAEKWQRRQDKSASEEAQAREGEKELNMRKEEMNREKELKVVLDRERLDQVVRNTREHMMSRGEKNKEGWAQQGEHSGLAKIDSLRKALRAIEVDMEERNKEDSEMVDLTEEEKKHTM